MNSKTQRLVPCLSRFGFAGLVMLPWILVSAPAGAEPPVPPMPKDAVPAKVQGSLDKNVIRKVIAKHISEVKTCYEKRLKVKKDLQGQLVAHFVIGTSGEVTTATAGSSTLKDPETEECILKAIKSWTFPKPKSGVVTVDYPFALRAVDDAPPPAARKAPPAHKMG